MKKWLLKFAQGFIPWAVDGQTLAIMAGGLVQHVGIIRNPHLDENGLSLYLELSREYVEDGVMLHISQSRIRWNGAAGRFEVFFDDVDYKPGRATPDAVGERGDRSRDFTSAGEEREHGQDAPDGAGPEATPDGNPDGEGEGSPRTRHDGDPPIEGTSGGTVRTSPDSVPDISGLSRTVAIGVDNRLADGMLLGRAPDGREFPHHFNEPPPEMPDGTMVLGNARTIEALKRRIIGSGFHTMTKH